MAVYSVPELKLRGAAHRATLAVILLAAVLPPVLARADSLRCGNRLIVTEMAAVEVRRLCGEPESMELEERPIIARGPHGTFQNGTYRVERWLYRRGGGRFPAQLTFESGKLIRIQLLTRTRS